MTRTLEPGDLLHWNGLKYVSELWGIVIRVEPGNDPMRGAWVFWNNGIIRREHYGLTCTKKVDDETPAVLFNPYSSDGF